MLPALQPCEKEYTKRRSAIRGQPSVAKLQQGDRLALQLNSRELTSVTRRRRHRANTSPTRVLYYNIFTSTACDRFCDSKLAWGRFSYLNHPLELLPARPHLCTMATEVIYRETRRRYRWPEVQLNLWILIILASAGTVLGTFAWFITVQEQLEVGIPWYVFGETLFAA